MTIPELGAVAAVVGTGIAGIRTFHGAMTKVAVALDRIDRHERRLSRLESHTGIARGTTGEWPIASEGE